MMREDEKQYSIPTTPSRGYMNQEMNEISNIPGDEWNQ